MKILFKKHSNRNIESCKDEKINELLLEIIDLRKEKLCFTDMVEDKWIKVLVDENMFLQRLDKEGSICIKLFVNEFGKNYIEIGEAFCYKERDYFHKQVCNFLKLTNIDVNAKYQSLGYGSKMLGELKNFAIENNFKEISYTFCSTSIEEDNKRHKFYTTNGFKNNIWKNPNFNIGL